MLYVWAFTALVISACVVFYLTPKLLLLSLKKRMVDNTSNRKIHTTAASRLGGFSFFPAIFLSAGLTFFLIYLYDKQLLFAESTSMRFILGCCSLFVIYIAGVSDDMIGVRYRKKLFWQLLAAILIAMSGIWLRTLHGFCGLGELSPYIGISLTVFLLVLIMNSINFIDGIDGLASLLSINALLVYGILFLMRASVVDSLIAFATIGALIPFCYFNLFRVRKKYDSKIFMGDSGSLVIGLVLGTMAIKLWNMPLTGESFVYPYTIAYTMLFVPCFDLVRVSFCRIKARTPLFLPDNRHIHHLLLKAGFGQRQVLLILVLMQLFFLFLNIGLSRFLNITFIILIDILFLTLFIRLISKTPIKKMNR